jgi:hypothetical protein
MRIVSGKYKAALKFYGYNEYQKNILKRVSMRPWRIIEPCVGINYLEAEKEKALQGISSPSCPEGLFCGRCNACQSQLDK